MFQKQSILFIVTHVFHLKDDVYHLTFPFLHIIKSHHYNSNEVVLNVTNIATQNASKWIFAENIKLLFFATTQKRIRWIKNVLMQKLAGYCKTNSAFRCHSKVLLSFTVYNHQVGNLLKYFDKMFKRFKVWKTAPYNNI